ncbi:MAG: shikimate kinase [Cellvibrionaceae bacterium]|nr:shikimate kinase [Cellvibrionaceae bacterium]
MNDNIILIGLPGAGKSSLGALLARHLAYHFVDTDHLIQAQQAQSLQDILSTKGSLALRHIEEQALLALDTQQTVIATGGSAIYSHRAMMHLQNSGKMVYLHISPETALQRIDNQATRGIARAPEQTLQQVLTERLPLYQGYANITFNNENITVIDAVKRLLKLVSEV